MQTRCIESVDSVSFIDRVCRLLRLLPFFCDSIDRQLLFAGAGLAAAAAAFLGLTHTRGGGTRDKQQAAEGRPRTRLEEAARTGFAGRTLLRDQLGGMDRGGSIRDNFHLDGWAERLLRETQLVSLGHQASAHVRRMGRAVRVGQTRPEVLAVDHMRFLVGGLQDMASVRGAVAWVEEKQEPSYEAVPRAWVAQVDSEIAPDQPRGFCIGSPPGGFRPPFLRQ